LSIALATLSVGVSHILQIPKFLIADVLIEVYVFLKVSIKIPSIEVPKQRLRFLKPNVYDLGNVIIGACNNT
jgi:hypothetical protein